MQVFSSYLPIYHPHYKPDDVVRMMKDVGFQGLAISWEQGNEAYMGVNGREQAQLAEKYGLIMEQTHLTCNHNGDLWFDDTRGDAVEEMTIKELHEIAALGIPVAVTHLTYGPGYGPANPVGIQRLLRIGDAAGKLGVRVALENTSDTPHLTYALDAIDHEYIGFCLDTGHQIAYTPHINYLSLYADRLFAMHLHDNDAAGDLHMIPFDGNADWERFAAGMRKTEYAYKYLTLEPGSFNYWPYFPLPLEEQHRRGKDMKIYGDEGLLKIGKDEYRLYSSLTPVEFMQRQLNALQRLAGMLGE